jgi:hypothetical protein
MGRFTVIRTPAFDLLAAQYAREHFKLEADITWLTGRLAEAPEQMGDHVPELGGWPFRSSRHAAKIPVIALALPAPGVFTTL